MIKVSIIIPVYNIEEYIARCIESIRSQSMKSIEIIVVNDGSNDNTLAVIDSIVKRDKRIILINKENEGVSKARVSGLKAAKGEFILFVDGDDWLEEGTLDILYKKAIKCKSDIVVYNSLISYENGNTIPLKIFKEQINSEACLKELLLSNIYPNLVAKLIRKKFILDNDIVFEDRIQYGEDLVISMLLFINNPKVEFVQKHLYNYFQREDSATKVKDIRILDIRYAIDKIKNILIDRNKYEIYIEEFNYLAYIHIYYLNIIGISKYNKYNKELYLDWMKRDIDITNNKYYLEFIKTKPLGIKIKEKMFNTNYKLGVTYSNFR